MKILFRSLTFVVSIVVLLISCQNNKKTANLAPNAHQVKAEEVIQTSAYTYIRVSEDNRDYWLAIEKADIKERKTYYWSQGMEMNNFTSKELKRTFPSIFFIQDFTDQPILANQSIQPKMPAGKRPIPEKSGIVVPRAEGGVTIAELFSQKNSFSGKTIRIRGEVVKFSGQIMNMNWVHLQDGTKFENRYDLTVTTKDSVSVGHVVLFEGKVALDRDFGAGYTYDVIVEDAVLKK